MCGVYLTIGQKIPGEISGDDHKKNQVPGGALEKGSLPQGLEPSNAAEIFAKVIYLRQKLQKLINTVTMSGHTRKGSRRESEFRRKSTFNFGCRWNPETIRKPESPTMSEEGRLGWGPPSLELPSKGKKATKDRPNMVVKPHMRAESEPGPNSFQGHQNGSSHRGAAQIPRIQASEEGLLQLVPRSGISQPIGSPRKGIL